MLLDIALGVLGTVIFTRIYDVASTPTLFAVHIFLALLPDADFIFHIFKKRGFAKVNASHRYLLHNPLLYIPIGFVFIAPFSLPLAVSFAAMSLAHFIHDSIGIGWGVRWLYPFSKRSFKLFSDHDGRISFNLITSWLPEEENELEKRWNPKNDWFRRVYLRPHPIGITEHVLAIFIVILACRLLL